MPECDERILDREVVVAPSIVGVERSAAQHQAEPFQFRQIRMEFPGVCPKTVGDRRGRVAPSRHGGKDARVNSRFAHLGLQEHVGFVDQSAGFCE
jgi:hypothetical protein